MVTGGERDLLQAFLEWAVGNRAVGAVVLFGSRARAASDINAADSRSDLDLQVITRHPALFNTRQWVNEAFPRHHLRAYAVRPVPGRVKKVTVILRPHAELDLVVLPGLSLRILRFAVRLGIHRHSTVVARLLDELATVMRPGHKVLIGGRKWTRFYADVSTQIRGTRIDDAAVRFLADEFVCDYVWLMQKVERGELITSQRMLHRSLAEINFQLMHELRLRLNRPSFREARRVEQILSVDEWNDIAVEASLKQAALRLAAERSAKTCRKLVAALIGDNWRWPD